MKESKKTEERKKEILDIAEHLFQTKGYAETTIIDILEEVGIAKGTFYYYFKSKEEVMNSIVLRCMENGVSEAKEIAVNQEISIYEKVVRIFMSLGSMARPKDQIIEKLQQKHSAEMHQKSIVETILQLTPVLNQVVEQGIAEGEFTTPFPKETIEFLLSSCLVLFDEGIIRWTSEEKIKKIEAFSCIAERTLGAEKGSFQCICQLYQMIQNKK
ncbi:TetR/AcrR family transcriptional regulator [Anaeromicropila populeti]|uniref:Transcriptional regulator, TetR family n=1 Tax=Anaeromicropila populeti TaxID=37658 RepID=A0A1I6LGH7_9FIRM|nr:TetR/AcrR family transcriptional regulator [Anaeromicropila populeti]SFS02567.1 transcriptional regulator, TetR family [Anaeromicropila populeti]